MRPKAAVMVMDLVPRRECGLVRRKTTLALLVVTVEVKARGEMILL